MLFRSASALAVLEAELPRTLNASPVFSPVPIEDLEQSTAEWLETIADESYIVIAARASDSIVGFALACSTSKSALHSGLLAVPNSVTLAQVTIDPAWRGRGVARALAMAAIREARKRGFTAIVTDWRSTNLAADAAWRALGFQPAAYRLQRVIGPHG